MPRCAAAVLAAVIALAPHATAVTSDRTTAAIDNAWLIVVDDLHIDFVNTGRLRSLLRAVASELIHDGDLFELRTTGPSTATLQTSERDRLEPAIKGMTGSGLKATDTLGAVWRASAWDEVLYRADVALATATDAMHAFAIGDGNRKAIIYISKGYDLDALPGLGDRVTAFARRAREDGITIFAIDARSMAVAAPLDPRVDPAESRRYTAATRRSLTMIAENAGGFVIEMSNEPAADLQRISFQMR